MKANEFIKEHGLNKAKVLLSTQGKTIANLKSKYTEEQLKEYQGYIVSGDLISFVELKRLIESHELVEKRGGLSEAKAVEQQYWNSGVGAAMIVAMEIKQAILDVESCQ